jgi:hypothetical protein
MFAESLTAGTINLKRSEDGSCITLIESDFRDITEHMVAIRHILKNVEFQHPVNELIIKGLDSNRFRPKGDSEVEATNIMIIISCFQDLTHLVLDNLPQLIDNCFECLLGEFWSSLKSLKITKCTSLTHKLFIFFSHFWKNWEVFQFTCRFFVSLMETFDSSKEVYFELDEKELVSLFDCSNLCRIEIQLDYITNKSLRMLSCTSCIQHLHLILLEYGQLSMSVVVAMLIIPTLLTFSIMVKTNKIVDLDRTVPESYLKLSNFVGDELECEGDLILLFQYLEQVKFYELVNFLRLSDKVLIFIYLYSFELNVVYLINCGNYINMESMYILLNNCMSLKLLVVTKVMESMNPTRLELITLKNEQNQDKQVIFAVQCGRQKWDKNCLKSLKNYFGEIEHHFDWLVAQTFNFFEDYEVLEKVIKEAEDEEEKGEEQDTLKRGARRDGIAFSDNFQILSQFTVLLLLGIS